MLATVPTHTVTPLNPCHRPSARRGQRRQHFCHEASSVTFYRIASPCIDTLKYCKSMSKGAARHCRATSKKLLSAFHLNFQDLTLQLPSSLCEWQPWSRTCSIPGQSLPRACAPRNHLSASSLVCISASLRKWSLSA